MTESGAERIEIQNSSHARHTISVGGAGVIIPDVVAFLAAETTTGTEESTVASSQELH